jgi:hypothetical protein
MHGGTLPRVEYDSQVGAEEAARCLTSISTHGGTTWVLRVLALGKVLRVLTLGKVLRVLTLGKLLRVLALAKPACVASHPRTDGRATLRLPAHDAR